jgi:hypothetical protein
MSPLLRIAASLTLEESNATFFRLGLAGPKDLSTVDENERELNVPKSVGYADRRCGPRFSAHLAGNEIVEIWLDPARPHIALILNESMEGVGLMVDREPDLQPGQIIEVVYRGFRRRGVVQHVSAGQSGWRLGLRWKLPLR